MRAVIQRVKDASVVINSGERREIGRGLVVLLAIEDADTTDDIVWLSGKIARLRIFNDEQGLMNRSVQDINGEVLLISQFTLFASTKKGNRPSFTRAAKPDVAVPVYETFAAQLRQALGKDIQTGVFRADMLASLSNDGPVTIVIDSRQPE